MKPINVRELKKLCEEQIKLGNGDKVIMVSDDDEGNGYHYLWYAFLLVKDYEEQLEFEFANEDIAKKEDTIILG